MRDAIRVNRAHNIKHQTNKCIPAGRLGKAGFFLGQSWFSGTECVLTVSIILYTASLPFLTMSQRVITAALSIPLSLSLSHFLSFFGCFMGCELWEAKLVGRDKLSWKDFWLSLWRKVIGNVFPCHTGSVSKATCTISVHKQQCMRSAP